MKKGFILVALLAALLVLAACATPTPAATEAPQPTEAATEAPTEAPTEAATEEPAAGCEGCEGELNIIAWAGYVEDGSTDPNYDWVTGFEAETGCQVNVTTAATSDEMVTLMNQGGFDLVTASGDASLRLIFGGTVQPVDISRIPSYNNVDERLQEGGWHYVDADGDGTPEHYGTPYQWGANVLMYNTETFPEPPTSWGVIIEEQTLPDGKSNAGRVQAYDGPIYLADLALYLKSARPELGIEDPYALNREQFDAVIALAQAQNELIFRYWHDVTVQIADFTDEGVVASSSWGYQVNTLVASGAPIASVVPAEGATGWADTTMLHADSEHPNCAYAWMEHSLDPKVQGDVASWFSSVPAVPAACEGGVSLIDEAGCETNGINEFDNIAFWKTPTADCFGTGAEGDCVAYDEWVSEYSAIIGQ